MPGQLLRIWQLPACSIPWAPAKLCPWGMLLLQHGQRQPSPIAAPVPHACLAAPLKLAFYCRMGIANRDLKLENTLLDRRGPDALLKICDFGYSINENTSMPRSAVGTPGYTGEGLQLHAGQSVGHAGGGAQVGVLCSGQGQHPWYTCGWCRLMLATTNASACQLEVCPGFGACASAQASGAGCVMAPGSGLASGHIGGTRPDGVWQNACSRLCGRRIASQAAQADAASQTCCTCAWRHCMLSHQLPAAACAACTRSRRSCNAM